MKHLLYTFIILVISSYAIAPEKRLEYVGNYGDWTPSGEALTTSLELFEDNSFLLTSTEYTQSNAYKKFTNRGKWIVQEGYVILNPELTPRKPRVFLKESGKGTADSITIKVNHSYEVYENQKLKGTEQINFELLTLFFNKKRNYCHLTREGYKERSCAWAPKLKRRQNVDSTNTFKIPRQTLETIGVLTYGFKQFYEVAVKKTTFDYLEIDVVLPIDLERMPRSKKVKIRKRHAYFHENKKGEPDMFWAMPLRKKIEG